MFISGQVVDPFSGEVEKGGLEIDEASGRILRRFHDNFCDECYILPGFVDAHIHIESTMLLPSRFAAIALTHGTLAVVADPHEIANVMGVRGIRALIADGAGSPFVFSFGVPSCVPATEWEPGGARIDAEDVRTLLREDGLGFLGEVMNFPGVLAGEPELAKKLAHARDLGLPIDGHAPGLSGEALRAYAAAGITTDHECSTVAEALEKIGAGIEVQMREGSAARNFDDLLPLFFQAPGRLMFCSDDIHADELLKGHINRLVARALTAGVPLKAILHAASVHPVTHYRLPLGLLREGDSADFIILESPLEKVRVREAWMRGRCVARNGKFLDALSAVQAINSFKDMRVSASDFAIAAKAGAGAGAKQQCAENYTGEFLQSQQQQQRAENYKDKFSDACAAPAPESGMCTVRVIEVTDGQILTEKGQAELPMCAGQVCADPKRDILKIAVAGRYPREGLAPAPSAAFVRGFGIRAGAIAGSVAHDAHNIIAVGSSDDLMARAVNRIAESRGGIAAVGPDGTEHFLPLPFGGIMALDECAAVAERIQVLDSFVRGDLASPLHAPFMTLSFLALLVIPKLKLGEKGLFDGEAFCFVSCAV